MTASIDYFLLIIGILILLTINISQKREIKRLREITENYWFTLEGLTAWIANHSVLQGTKYTKVINEETGRHGLKTTSFDGKDNDRTSNSK